MKKNFLLAAIVIIALSSFAIGEQEYEFRIKQREINFIGSSLDGIKQSLASSDLPTKQSLQIFNAIDSIERIFKKNVRPVEEKKKK